MDLDKISLGFMDLEVPNDEPLFLDVMTRIKCKDQETKDNLLRFKNSCLINHHLSKVNQKVWHPYKDII